MITKCAAETLKRVTQGEAPTTVNSHSLGSNTIRQSCNMSSKCPPGTPPPRGLQHQRYPSEDFDLGGQVTGLWLPRYTGKGFLLAPAPSSRLEPSPIAVIIPSSPGDLSQTLVLIMVAPKSNTRSNNGPDDSLKLSPSVTLIKPKEGATTRNKIVHN